MKSVVGDKNDINCELRSLREQNDVKHLNMRKEILELTTTMKKGFESIRYDLDKTKIDVENLRHENIFITERLNNRNR